MNTFINLARQNLLSLKSLNLVKLSFLIIALLSLFLPVRVLAAGENGKTYFVGPGQSIQNTLNQMSPGDTLFINPGIYQESLNIPTSGLIIQGKGAPTIDAGKASIAVAINNVANTTLQGLVIRNSNNHLIDISGSSATGNKILNCTLLEWSLNPGGVTNWNYAAAVNIRDGAGYTSVDSCYIYRGNYEYSNATGSFQFQPDPQSFNFWQGTGHNTFTNNFIVGVALNVDDSNIANLPTDASGVYQKAILDQSDFGDGYPYYKFNLGDNIDYNEPPTGEQVPDFDDTVFSGNQLFGAHDDLLAVQGADRNLNIENNYIDAMGGMVGIVLREASVGPISISHNTLVNYGDCAFKYGGWNGQTANALKQITDNVFYSTLGRSYGSAGYYVPMLDTATYSRVVDGEVNDNQYDNLNMNGNKMLSLQGVIVLASGSGTNNTFTNNQIYSVNRGTGASIKWFGNYISFADFNSRTGGTNTCGTFAKPMDPPLTGCGAK